MNAFLTRLYAHRHTDTAVAIAGTIIALGLVVLHLAS